MDTGLLAPLNGVRPMPRSIFHRTARNLPLNPLSPSIIAWWGAAGVQVDAVLPYTVVPNSQPMVPVIIAGEGSCPWPASNVSHAPIPPDFHYQLDSDSHAVLVQLDASGAPLYEFDFWFPSPNADGSWTARVAVQWNILAGDLQRAGVTSANVYGGAILPYLITREDALFGLNHAAAFTLAMELIGPKFVSPAVFGSGPATDARAVGIGTRIRLQQDLDVSGLPFVARNIAEGLKEYGAFLVDAGAVGHFTGTPDLSQWVDELVTLREKVTLANFEVLA